MGNSPRQAYEQSCRQIIAESETRLEKLRHLVERSRPHQREAIERQLDQLRGSVNRARARTEAIHSAPDASWNFARMGADEAMTELQSGVSELEGQLNELMSQPAS